MKQTLFKLLSVFTILAMMLAALPMQNAQAASIITQWTFESPNTPAGATGATYPNAIAPATGSGNAGGVHASASTAWSTPAGNGSTDSFSSNYWAVGDYYQFSTSTAGFTGISLSWDQTGSNTGPRDFKLSYSTDGTAFTDFGSTYSITNDSWSISTYKPVSTISRDLSTITALENQANVYFRLVVTSATAINGSPVAAGGTDRVDNFTVSGTAIPVDAAPSVSSSTPADGATNVALDGNITISFSEPVNVTGSWFSLSCSTSGTHTAAESGGPTSFMLDPATDFVNGETCTMTVYAASVSDQDAIDPPDAMAADYTATFTTVPVTPTNPTGVGAADPLSVPAGGSSLLTMTVTPGANPTSSGLGVSCDLTDIGGSNPQVFYDDGSNGDLSPSDNIFSFYATVDSGTSIGSKSLPCTITDEQSRSNSASIDLGVSAYVPPAGTIVISQVYGGGGNAGATYKNDFIELFNRGSTTITLNGWSVQYGSAGGTGAWSVTPLTGSIAPGKYYLVQEAAGTGGLISLPTPDAAGTIAMSATAAKVALVTNSVALSGACPSSNPAISDLVGYGTANCFETLATLALTNTTAAVRNMGGMQDTNNNRNDFTTTGGPTPRNSLYPFTAVGTATPSVFLSGTPTLLTVSVTPGVNPDSTGIGVICNLSGIGGSATQTLYDDASNGDVSAGDLIFSYLATDTTPGTQYVTCTFSDAQGRSDHTSISMTLLTVLPIGTVNGQVLDGDNPLTHASPYVGQTVLIEGVIYETTLQAISNSTNTYKGFYIQNTAATRDGLDNTSDGLFVFMNTNSTITGGYTPTVGDEVVISGTVSEYYNMTELTSPALVLQVRSGVNIDAEIVPVVAKPPDSAANANLYWERLQGSRVQVPQDSIVLGGRNVFSPADAEIWLARSDSTIGLRTTAYTNRAFRDAHPLDDNYDATTWDGNGYRILMGSLGIKAAAGNAQTLIAPARTFSKLSNAPAGGLNYTFSKYRIEVSEQPTFNLGLDPAANHPVQVFDRSIGYSIVDYNLENLYDYRDNPFSGCDFATDTAGCPKVAPFQSAVTPPYDYVPVSDAVYQARLNDIALQIINDLHNPDILMVQEVENQDICTVTDGALTCGTTDNADGKPDVLQELALKIAALPGGQAYDAAFDRDSSDLRGIAPAFLYRTDRVELRPAAGDPILGTSPAIGGYTPVALDSDVSNPKTFNAVLPSGVTACETDWVFPRAPDVGLFRIYSTSIGVGSYRDVYVINNHFKSGPDSCVSHRTEQAKYNAALVEFIQAANPNARIVLGGDLNVYPRPDDIAYGASDQLGSLYAPALGLKNLWEVLLDQAPESAYSYVYLGMAQTLDQMFINQPMLADLKQFRIAHINSDFPAEYPDDVARGTSDHDPNVATFVINDPPTADAGGPYTVDEGNSTSLSATGTDPEGQQLTYAWDLDNNGTFETPGQSVSFTGVDGPATLIVNVQVTDNGGMTASASTTVTVNNVAPTATFNAPASVNEGSNVSLSLTNPVDVAADLGSLQFAFDCGSGYGSFSATSTASCPTADNGTLNVGGKVMDKDGGVNEYTATVTVNNVAPAATFNAPTIVYEGAGYSISLTNPVDVAADLGSLQYSFNCGSGYGAFSASNTATCTAVNNPNVTVKGKIKDKDGGVTEYTATVIIQNIPPNVNAPVVLPEPSIEGSIVIAGARFSDPGVKDAPFKCTVNYGDGSGALPGIVIGSTCTGPIHIYKAYGTYTVTISVTDKDGGTGSNTKTHKVIFKWAGFFNPVKNPPIVNVAKAGSAIPVKFSLGGNKGLNIFASGYPVSAQMTCPTGLPLSTIGQTVNAGSSHLTYDPSSKQYIYTWKTDVSWAGTCRQLVLQLVDGTLHVANFKFK